MIRRSPRWCLALLAALALLLQVDAVVKSTVMTALGPLAAANMPGCDGASSMAMTGMTHMAMAGASKAPAARAPHVPPARPDAGAHCPYCAAAAHAPLTAMTVPLRPSCAVSFTAYRTAASQGPRGPPSIRPRARGPPSVA